MPNPRIRLIYYYGFVFCLRAPNTLPICVHCFVGLPLHFRAPSNREILLVVQRSAPDASNASTAHHFTDATDTRLIITSNARRHVKIVRHCIHMKPMRRVSHSSRQHNKNDSERQVLQITLCMILGNKTPHNHLRIESAL